MSLVAVPFYQKRHKHFDQSYRNIQTRYLLDEYSAKKKRASAQSSLQRSVTRKSSSQRESSRAALGESTLGETTLGETSLGDTTLGRTTCRLCAKRMSSALEEEAQERKRRYQSMVAAYGEAKRERYLSELAQLEEDVHVARTHARDQLDRLALQHAGRHGLHHAVDDRLAWERHSFEERISRAPEILVRLRSHTVWERMSVKLCFTVQGFPTPVVQWYKDGSLICQAGEPGKYRIDSKYGVHTLEINR
nr:PREDICTED: myomesin-2-like [Bos indicus]